MARNALRYVPVIAVLCWASLPVTLVNASQLSGPRIEKTLSGNSVIHPDFGCVYFDPKGITKIITRNGSVRQGRWGVLGDLYYSNASCSIQGCKLTGKYPNFVFERTDGGYAQPVMLVPGNHCDQDATIS